MRKESVILLGVLLLLIGACSDKTATEPFVNELDHKIQQSVDLWTSVHYEIIRDAETIRSIDPPVDSNQSPIMVAVSVKTMNKGDKRAEAVTLEFDEPTPFTYTNASGGTGENHGYLDKGETQEAYYYYTFDKEELLEPFIEQLAIQIGWTEEGEVKTQKVQLPSEPIR